MILRKIAPFKLNSVLKLFFSPEANFCRIFVRKSIRRQCFASFFALKLYIFKCHGITLPRDKKKPLNESNTHLRHLLTPFFVQRTHLHCHIVPVLGPVAAYYLFCVFDDYIPINAQPTSATNMDNKEKKSKFFDILKKRNKKMENSTTGTLAYILYRNNKKSCYLPTFVFQLST